MVDFQTNRYDNFLRVNREEEWDRLVQCLDLKTEEEREAKDEKQTKKQNDTEELDNLKK